MAYFIYRITETPIRLLNKLEQHDAYRDAQQRAKALRTEMSGNDGATIKVIFAETELHAEDLLSVVRAKPQGPGDD
jgi:DNA-binding protein H-NS